MTEAERLVSALSDAMRTGEISQDNAQAMIADVQQKRMTVGDALTALDMAGIKTDGFDRTPDAAEPTSSVRVVEKAMSKLAKQTDPKALKGTGAGKLMTAAKVKDVGDRFSRKRYEVKRPNGSVLTYGGLPVETPSQFDLFLIGSWFKAALIASGYNMALSDGQKRLTLSDAERSVLVEGAEREQWVGQSKSFDYGGYSPDGYIPRHEIKALLDDTVSGGISAVPAVLDAALITKPLLSGQLFPFVDAKPAGGRRVIAPKLGNLTGGWGTAPGTAVQPFNTAGLMTSVDTPLFTWNGFLELSNELESDSAIDLGAAVVNEFGERLRSELDRVVAVGNGTNEPWGIFNATGVTTTSSDNGAGGPVTVSDAESLIFGLPLQYRQGWEASYIGNDTSYRRFRSIQVGPGDERRVFGQGMMGTDDTQRYQLFEYKYRVANDVPNSKCGFVALKKYRMYTRGAVEVIRERGGRALALSNTQLIGLRARYGGQLVDTAAAVIMTDLQS